MTIRSKIIVLLVGSIFVIAAGISLVAGTKALEAADEEFRIGAEGQLDRVGELVDTFLRSGEHVAEALSNMPEGQLPLGALTDYTKTAEATKLDISRFTAQEAPLFRRLDEARSLMPAVEIALFGMQDGGYIKSPATSIGKGYDPRTRPWYKDIIENNRSVSITDPYVSSSTKTLVTTVSARVTNSRGETIGVAGVDFILGELTDILKNAQVGKTGYLLMFDRKGRVMLDPKGAADSVMKHAGEVGDAGLAALAAEPAGVHFVERGGVELIALSRVLPKTGWKAVMVMERAEERAAGNSMVAAVAMVIAGLGVAIVVVGVLMARGITTPLNRLVAQVNEAANGNFDALSEVPRGSTPEVVHLHGNLRSMVEQIRGLIQSTNSKAEEAEAESGKAAAALIEAENARREAEEATRKGRLDAAAQLEAIVTQATDAARLLEEQIRHASVGSDAQVERSDRVQEIVQQMSSTATHVAGEAAQTEENADATREKAEEGSTIVSEVVNAIDLVHQRSMSLTEDLNGLGIKAEGIGTIMNMITDIADQTNLLALNAAIEAARAGDAGRGFAVVADEVRKLAEKTMSATKEVGEAVASIQQGTAESIASMSKNGEVVSQCTGLAVKAGDSLRNILDVARSTAEQVRVIVQISEEQAQAGDTLNESSSEVSRLADNNAALMDDAQNAVTEISRLITRIQEVVADLKRP